MKDPEAGKRLRLSIDFDVQKAGQAALERYGLPGGFVAMDPRSGEVIGLGSNPGYDPNVFAKGVRASVYKRLQDPDNGAPLANRATQGLYPTGSTFKLITATAGARERADHALDGALRRRVADRRRGHLQERGRTSRTARVALPRALQVSSDVFFYRVGLMAEQRGGEIIQKWARRLGLGRPTGIDLPGEGARPRAHAGVAQPALPAQPHRPPLDAGRQHQPRGRPGRPPGRPAPDGRRLQRDRERRPDRHAPHRPAGRGQRRPHPPADRARGAAPDRRVLDHARARSCRACARPRTTPAARRRRCSRASRSRSRARPAPRSAGHRATSPGTSRSRPPTTRGSSSRRRSSAGASARRPRRPPTRRILAAYFGVKGKKAVGEAGVAPD